MEHTRIPTSEQLMAEMAWVRRLARALVRDDAAADDVAQDAFLVATAQQPAEDRPLRPWLARVVVNLVRTRRRGTARREQRGAAFERERAVPTPTPAELVVRLELQRAVADEVLALVEPYRSTVLLHFVEGFTSTEIAGRLGIPDGTVRRRLKVALDRLREALRARTDPPRRDGWLAALAPLARGPSSPTTVPTAIGVLAMKKVIGLVLAIVLLLVLALWVVRRDGGSSNTDGAGTPARIADAERDRAHPSSSGSAAPAAIPAWLAPEGVPARRIAGRVVAHGQPVGGAHVLLGRVVTGETVPIDLPLDVLQPIAATTSAADGTFDFGVQPSVGFVVSASAADRAAVAVTVAPWTAADQLVLALGDCSSRMSGTISDASGGAIAKARIAVAGLSGTESDALGHYSVCLWAPARFGSPMAQIRIEADHYGTVNHVVLAASELHRDFALVPEATLVGRVTTRDGRAVAGAQVIAMIEPSEIRMHTGSGWATSDRDGAFRIANLAPGAFQLTASAQGLATNAPVAAIARPAANSRELHLVVGPRTQIRGRVEMGGAPVAGESVTAVLDGGGPLGTATSRADGSFVLDGMPNQGAITFALVRHDLVAPKTLVRLAGAPLENVMLEVVARATIRGRVTRHGQPVAGATVLYTEAPQAIVLNGPQPATSDATGAFALEGVRPGKVRVAAYDSVANAFSDWQAVDAVTGETRTLDLVLDRSGAVKGTVVDPAGAPVAGVHVLFELANGDEDVCETMTDTGGRFDCTMLGGGEYRPTVSPAPGIRGGFAPATGDHFALVHVPQDDVVTGVTLAIVDERFAIAGRVVDDLGAPVPDVRVEAIGNGGGVTMDLPGAATDANGHFEVGNLARGTYNLHAHAADGSDTEVLAVAAGTKTVAIALARAGAIDGTLTGFSTTPRVLTTSLTPDLRMGGWAIVDGTSFSQIGLPPGRYTVDAKAGVEVDGQTVDVRPGETAHVALRSRGTGMVRGTVTELATHAPVVGFRCDAILSMNGQMSGSPPDPSLQTYTDASGHFTASAPIGHVRILCFSPAGGPLSPAGGDVDVAGGSTAANLATFSVRGTFGNAPGDAGFAVNTMLLPVTVTQVVPGGPAAAAGLAAGDRIVTIDGASLQGLLAEGAMMLVANHRPGTVMTLGIERAGVARTLEIKVGGS